MKSILYKTILAFGLLVSMVILMCSRVPLAHILFRILYGYSQARLVYCFVREIFVRLRKLFLIYFFLCSGILKLHLALLQKFHETAQAWGLEQRISWSLTKDSISCLAIFLCRFLSLPTAALSAYL